MITNIYGYSHHFTIVVNAYVVENANIYSPRDFFFFLVLVLIDIGI